MKTALRQLCLPLAFLTVGSLSACGGSSPSATAPQKTSPSTLSSSVARKPAPSPSPQLLTKAQFVAKMDPVCVDFTTRIQRLPQPTSEEDYTTLAAAMDGTLKLFPAYIKQAEALVSRAVDKATLTENWLTVEKSDFAALAPALRKFIADVKAKNNGKLAADLHALDLAPDHSEAIAGFMSGYGLKSCAILERA